MIFDMFKTIRAKVTVNVFLVLLVLAAIITCFNFAIYQKTKKGLLENYGNYAIVQSKKINKLVMAIEDNALDLAVFGEVYYNQKYSRDFLEKFVAKVFRNYDESLGGGIWFEPYTMDPNSKFHNVYVYKNKNNEIVVDRHFESEEYNYLNQKWYKEISTQLKAGKKVAWSSPYYEKEGSNSLMVSSGSGIYDGDKLVGISTVDWQIEDILKSVEQIHPTPNIFADKNNDYVLISTDKSIDDADAIGASLKSIPWYNDNLINVTYIKYQNKLFIPFVRYLDNDMMLIINIPKWELFRLYTINAIGALLILLVFCFVLFVLLYKLLQDNILNSIVKLEEAANKISEGNLDSVIEIKKPAEFAHLADTYAKMAKDIKSITYKQTMMESELQIAKAIQLSRIPQKFPPFPDKKEFNIFASMTTAKEVGGDFYDFYFVDDNNIMFLIADVSGKGVPAALFMMTTQAITANIAQENLSPKDMVEKINQKVCMNNREHLFVTMFICVVNIKTGDMACINCGHNPPLLYRKSSSFEYLNTDNNIVIGVFDKAKFNTYETKLNAGDKIFLYTDGITEAMNAKDEMYGEDRLLDCLNLNKENCLEEISGNVKESIKEFVNDTEQSDDITMLLFEFLG